MIHPDLRPKTQPIGKNRVVLLEDFYYRCPKTQIETLSKKGFIIDGMTIARILWSILGAPFSPTNIGPAFTHDNPYRFGVDMYGNSISRKNADIIIEQALKMNNVNWLVRKAVYSGLRTGGWVAWNKHRSVNK